MRETIQEWKLHMYLQHLMSLVPVNDNITKLHKQSKIKASFRYFRGENWVEGEIVMPWFLWIVKDWDINDEYFPDTKIKGVLLLFIAKHYSLVDDITVLSTTHSHTDVIVDGLLKWDLPSAEDLKNVELISFEVI